MASSIFSLTLHTRLGLPHPMALSLTHCTYGQPINLMGIHLLEGSRRRKCTTSHDVQNTFASISKNVGFHIFHEQSHVRNDVFTLASILTKTSWCCVIHKWGQHYGWSCHYQFHSGKSSIKRCYFLRSCDNCDPSKWWALLWSTPMGYAFISCWTYLVVCTT